MSQKNSSDNKKRQRVLKSLKTELPAYIDLIDYVRSRTRCTEATARKVLLSGALRVDSHPVGYKFDANGKKYLDPYIPASKRADIRIVKPKEL